jgi:hypothetical protein
MTRRLCASDGVVPRLRSPDRPGGPFGNEALPVPGDPPPPTRVGADLRWTRAQRPSRIASTIGFEDLGAVADPAVSGGVPDFKALLHRRVRDVP